MIQFSSLLTFPITFVSMAIVQQYQKDYLVTLLIIAFWTLPPAILESEMEIEAEKVALLFIGPRIFQSIKISFTFRTLECSS